MHHSCGYDSSKPLLIRENLPPTQHVLADKHVNVNADNKINNILAIA